MQDRPRPLIVPDLSRPPGADIDADGFVICQTCGARVDVMSADVIGEGYQCARCTALAAPPDVYAGTPSARRLALTGVALVIAGVISWMLSDGPPPTHNYRALALPGIAAAYFLMAWLRWRKR